MFGSGLLIASGPSVGVWAPPIDRSSAFRPVDFKSVFANNEHLSPRGHKPEHSHRRHTSIITGHAVFRRRSGSVERDMSRMSRSGEKVDVNYWHWGKKEKSPDPTAVKNTPFVTLYLQPLKVKLAAGSPRPPDRKLCLLKYHWSGTSYVKYVATECGRAWKCCEHENQDAFIFTFAFTLSPPNCLLELYYDHIIQKQHVLGCLHSCPSWYLTSFRRCGAN